MLKRVPQEVTWLLIILFVLFYPLFVSIYVNLPLFIGFAGYMVILGIEKRGMWYVWIALIYLTNLEVNLSLPLLIILFSVLLFRLTLYDKMNFMKRCSACIAFVSALFIDLYYLAMLLTYDFLFDADSIAVNSLLLYSLLFDLMLVLLV